MKYLLSIIFLMQYFTSYSQIFFDETVYDLGFVVCQRVSPIEFIFRNVCSKPVTILKIVSDPELTVYYNSEFIEPFDEGKIYVHYEGNTLGRFKHKVTFITNLSDEVYVLKIKGFGVKTQECDKDKIQFRKIFLRRKIRLNENKTEDKIEPNNKSDTTY